MLSSPPSTLHFAHSNSFVPLRTSSVPSSDSSKHPPPPPPQDSSVSLNQPVLRSLLRECSSYNQSNSGAERPAAYSWPCTALCIINSSVTPPPPPPSSSSVNVNVSASAPLIRSSSASAASLPFDLLLLGTHVHPSKVERTLGRRGGKAKACIFVSILSHLAEAPLTQNEEQEKPRSFRRSSSTRSNSSTSSSSPSSTVAPPSVRVIPSYGEFKEDSSASLLGGLARKLTGNRSAKKSGGGCATISRMIASPFRALFGRPPRHSALTYPRSASLAEHGVELEEQTWPWASSPFFGLELNWALDEAEWNAMHNQSQAYESSSSASSSGKHPRTLPIHPSHLCVQPTTGEILLTDHDTHAVYQITPCWIWMQRLKQLSEPKVLSNESMSSSSSSSSTPRTVEEVNPDFVLPLPDVLLSLIVSYIGNPVLLLAGETEVKGCKDGAGVAAAGSAARFNAPNGIAIHPRTGKIFVTDGHWNSRICTIQPNTDVQGAARTGAGMNGASNASSSSSALTTSSLPPRWNVASIPLHPLHDSLPPASFLRRGVCSLLRAVGLGQLVPTQTRSTWFSAVNHMGGYEHAPASWPLRLPTSPVILPAAGSTGSSEPFSSDALVLLDEELHILRHIPLCASSPPLVSTVAGRSGNQGNKDGWASEAAFLFPQALISLPHPLSRTPTPRTLALAHRPALLLADTGNDRLCLVNLVSREEMRTEARKQSMLRRQMRALKKQRRGGSGSRSSTPSASENEASDDDDSFTDATASSASETEEEDACLSGDDSGPLLGHVETIRCRGSLPAELDQHFIRAPWSPWSDMAAAAAAASSASESRGVATTLRQQNQLQEEEQKASMQPDESSSSSSSSSNSAAAPIAFTSSSNSSFAASALAELQVAQQVHALPAPNAIPSSNASSARFTPLTPTPFVHRGQNTCVRKMVVTAQGHLITLNRLGLQAWQWKTDGQGDE